MQPHKAFDDEFTRKVWLELRGAAMFTLNCVARSIVPLTFNANYAESRIVSFVAQREHVFALFLSILTMFNGQFKSFFLIIDWSAAWVAEKPIRNGRFRNISPIYSGIHFIAMR